MLRQISAFELPNFNTMLVSNLQSPSVRVNASVVPLESLLKFNVTRCVSPKQILHFYAYQYNWELIRENLGALSICIPK